MDHQKPMLMNPCCSIFDVRAVGEIEAPAYNIARRSGFRGSPWLPTEAQDTLASRREIEREGIAIDGGDCWASCSNRQSKKYGNDKYYLQTACSTSLVGHDQEFNIHHVSYTGNQSSIPRGICVCMLSLRPLHHQTNRKRGYPESSVGTHQAAVEIALTISISI